MTHTQKKTLIGKTESPGASTVAREEGFPEEYREPKSEERAARVLPCRTLYVTLRSLDLV